MQNKIIEFVRQELGNDNTGHDLNHAFRVVNNAKKILEKVEGNNKIIITACYLHDTVDHKLFADSAIQIKKIKELLEDEYIPSEIDEVIDIITSISFNNNDYKHLTNKNAMIVRDADRLDALGSMGIIRTIQYGTSHNRPFYDELNIKRINGKCEFNKPTNSTLSHFYDKLLKLEDLMHTDIGKSMARERVKIIKMFLEHFYDELG